MNHIVIIGFMGSGKTKVGKRLAQDLNLTFVDVDKEVSKRMNKMSIREIFERFGEAYYRAMETIIVKELLQDSSRKVISLSYGFPLQEQNTKLIKKLGSIVYLHGSLETLKKRIGGSSDHPMLAGENQEDKIKKLLKQCIPVYQKYADFEVVTGVKEFDELIKEIEEKLSKN